MKNKVKMMMLAGMICLSFNLIVKHFIQIPGDVVDFVKGFGVALIISCLFVQRKLEYADRKPVNGDNSET
jgi:hypothetical protein